MSNDHNQDKGKSAQQPTLRREMSRRQFLSYTLGGTGAFLISMPVIPMLRFTVDPLLQERQDTAWVKVVEEDKVTTEPQSFKFEVHTVDGWYEHNPKVEAWVAKDQNGEVFALSPICKHLGCTVNWDTNPQYDNEYYCPCHGAHYTKDGKALAIAPAPLDQYSVKIENGWVYLGQVIPNKRV
jgi:menaquinol-cytochrome c reductase iron-sulfur subunit